jgi:hypothetical protein
MGRCDVTDPLFQSSHQNLSEMATNVSPMASLKDELALIAGGERITHVSSTTDGGLDLVKLHNGTKVGANKQWHVVTEDCVMTKWKQDIEGRLTNLEKEVCWLSTETSVSYVRNVAAQILLFLHGSQPMVPTPNSYKFTGLGPADALAVKINTIATDTNFTMSSAYFTKIADKVINRRNGVIHYATEADLALAVQKSLEAFRIWPLLAVDCAEEHAIITNYNAIKAEF